MPSATRCCDGSPGPSARATREGDVLVRYGGEEFVVIAPATDGDGAVAAAERIRAAVAAAGAELVDGRIVPLTVSAGVASLVDESDGRGLFRAADSALLAAKRAGRDRVTKDLERHGDQRRSRIRAGDASYPPRRGGPTT